MILMQLLYNEMKKSCNLLSLQKLQFKNGLKNIWMGICFGKLRRNRELGFVVRGIRGVFMRLILVGRSYIY